MVEKTELTDTGTFRSSSNFYSSSNKKDKMSKIYPEPANFFSEPVFTFQHCKIINYGIILAARR